MKEKHYMYLQDSYVIALYILSSNSTISFEKAYCYKFDTLLYCSRSYTISCIWQGKNASFEFIMENCSDVFEIEKQSGRIKVKASSLLDIETHQSFKCQVSSTSLLDLSLILNKWIIRVVAWICRPCYLMMNCICYHIDIFLLTFYLFMWSYIYMKNCPCPVCTIQLTAYFLPNRCNYEKSK